TSHRTVDVASLGAVIDLPEDLPLPRRCPLCGESWVGYGTTADSVTVFLTCENYHRHDQTMTAEQVMTLLLAVAPAELLSRSIWVVGEDHPVSEERHMRLEPDHCVPGFPLTIDGQHYAVHEVDVDKVWIRPIVSD
ncbi:MAG: hypothetical protein ABSC30_17450, partial [Acidimicrobiales bacterium]